MEIRSGTARSGDLDIYYEDMGDPGDPAVLLIMGLGSQLLLWRDGFCEKLVAEGLRVIRYDNRDVGLSSKTKRGHSEGSMIPRMLKFWVGAPGKADYTLDDMADDGAAVLDHLGIDRAHIAGASMGGMIAQVFAARFRARTRSLAVIFSSNNQPFLPPPAPRALFAVLKGPPPGSPLDVIADNAVRVWGIIGSPWYPAPQQRIRARDDRGLRTVLLPVGRRPAFQRDRRQRQPAPLQPADQRAHRSAAWPGRQAAAPGRRPGGCPGDPGSPSGLDRRHGPRFARAAVGPADRRADRHVCPGLTSQRPVFRFGPTRPIDYHERRITGGW